MSTVTETTWDVFLSHGIQDAGVAEIVTNAFESVGLDVYAVDDIRPRSEFMAELRSRIAECGTFILILTRSTLKSANIAFEIGAAMAWNKPIYVLYDGIDSSEIPDYLHDFNIAPISKFSQVVETIIDSQKPISAEDRETLKRVYTEIGVPTDQMIVQPLILRDLVRRFHKATKTNVGFEVLIQELIHMRKQGQLPRLRKPAG